jgi:hypothetical protein
MRKNFLPGLLSALVLLSGAASSPAQVLAYWSFNDKNTHTDIGTASLSSTWFGLGPGTLVYATGTELNARPGYEAGFALGYVDIFTMHSNHRLQITGLDFSGLTDAELAFAVTTTELFGIGESAHVYYSLNGGGTWEHFGEIALPNSFWRMDTIHFGDLFDGQADVAIRIDYFAAFETGSSLRFDNVTISAVPEPASGTLALLALAGLARRRRSSRAE